MSESMRLVIGSGNILFGECLALALSNLEQVEVVDVIADAQGVFDTVTSNSPDIILIDIDLSDNAAFELIGQIRAEVLGVKLIILGVADTQPLIMKCIEAGVNGYHLKEAPLKDLVQTIYSVSQGEAVCSPRIVYSMFSRMAELAMLCSDEYMIDMLSLTLREAEVLRLIADGLSNKEIASRLNLSLYTIKNHVHKIMEKLQVNNRIEAVRYALRNGLINLEQKY